VEGEGNEGGDGRGERVVLNGHREKVAWLIASREKINKQ
jgi:hypothetical protein